MATQRRGNDGSDDDLENTQEDFESQPAMGKKVKHQLVPDPYGEAISRMYAQCWDDSGDKVSQ